MKRMLELFVALILSPIIIPILALTSICVLIFLGRPMLFPQMRGGYRGEPFVLWKFRSMTNERDADGNLLPDDRRLTKFGIFLRSTSLDEIPCFFNILRGDIGFVGPRPFIASYLPLYSQHEMRRHDVRPGITGWAQVCGRNSLSWQEKFELDLWYVDHQSIMLDFKILLLTVWKVLSRSGISGNDHATMPRFTGTVAESNTPREAE